MNPTEGGKKKLIINKLFFFFFYCGIQDFRDKLKVRNEPEVIKVVGPGFFFFFFF